MVTLVLVDKSLKIVMELLNETEINSIVKQFGLTKILKWRLEDFEDQMIGYLGDHLKLRIEAEKDGVKSELQLFVKCMPRFDKWKSEFLQESRFFYKEYVMLSRLFEDFHNGEGKMLTTNFSPFTLYLIQENHVQKTFK